jgi:hypothetical protein
MHAIINARHSQSMQLEMSFENFLSSGRIARSAKVAMCSPEDLVMDYLPPFDPGEPDEIREAFAEASYQAVDGAIDKIRLDDEDVAFVRRHFLRGRQLRLLETPLPDAA